MSIEFPEHAERGLEPSPPHQGRAADAAPSTGPGPHRVMFLYWGRRGGLCRFTSDLWNFASVHPDLDATISISRQNERFADFDPADRRLLAIDTFDSPFAAVSRLWSIPGIRRRLRDWLTRYRTETVVNLLPHVWTPLIDPVFARCGVRTATIVHDAQPHPGDRSGLAHFWYSRNIHRNDRLIALSQSVADQLTADLSIPQEKILTLFHPDFLMRREEAQPIAGPNEPFRLLFLGRILPYKGLDLLLDAISQLRSEGLAVTLGVFGEGDLQPYREHLDSLQAEVVNRWLSDEEIDAILARHHVLVLSHVEASQSGVAALAMGSGLPVIARRVGGLEEQVLDGRTGILADGEGSGPLALAIRRLAQDRFLYARIRNSILTGRIDRSMETFVNALASDLLARRSP